MARDYSIYAPSVDGLLRIIVETCYAVCARRSGFNLGERISLSHAEPPIRPPRLAVAAEVAVRRRSDLRYRVNLIDLSSEGCRIELVERAKPGDLMFISLPGLSTIEAEACWVDGFVTGVRFKTPLHPSVFDMIAQRMKATD